MYLEQEEIEVKGVKYTLKELTIGEVMPIIEKEGTHIGIELMKKAVYVDGEPLGEKANQLGFSVAKVLMDAVTRINGMSDTAEKS